MNRFLKRMVLGLATVGFLLLYIPLFTIVIFSFFDHSQETAVLTLKWYEKFLQNDALTSALTRSLTVALTSSCIATVLGTLGAYAIERSNFPGKKILEVLTIAPFILPEMVLGLALLIWFSIVKINLGWWSMTLAHTTFGVSYVVMVVRARIAEFDTALEDAARDLGANKLQVFMRINLPINTPGILSGFLMCFILSFDDFIIAFFTTGVATDTLPLKLYSMIKLGFDPQVYALSSVILFCTLLAVLLLSRLTRGSNALSRSALP